jgi:hypothetical protein
MGSVISYITKSITITLDILEDYLHNYNSVCYAQYKDLYYYDNVYVFAHHVFNNIRQLPNFGIDIQKGGKGGTLSLEEFKQIIREKIKLLDL